MFKPEHLLAAASTGLPFTLPLKDPVLIFAVVLLIILMMPILATRIRVPGLICLILAGVAVGPHGFHLLRRDSSIELFGTVGLLYIMFLAGLELDLNAFKKRKLRSLSFGALTFFIPLGLGFPVCHFFLGYDPLASLLIASMFSTHTMVAYPIVSRMGLTRNEAVAIAVGGTMITDTAVLVLLAVITGTHQGTISLDFWLRLLISLLLFGIVVFWFFPRIGSWFFRNLQGERTAQFTFILAMVFLAGFLAQLAGVEAIIGAFAAGLALNRLVPHTSALMYQLEFVGHALFIPFFLIGVGMLVDLNVLLKGPQALLVATTLTLVALLGKWLAAWLTQLLFRYHASQRDLIFGLSASHAAATLAVILIGFDLGLLDENVLNGTIILILITCMVASFVTERAGRALAVAGSESPSESQEGIRERILVPIANPHTMEKLLDFAVMIKDPSTKDPIHPLVVVQDDDEAQNRILQSRKTLEKAILHAATTETKVEVTTRVDLNAASGIARTVKELQISDIVLGWSDRTSAFDRLLGTMIDTLLVHTWQTIFVCHLLYPLNTTRRVVTVIPDNAEIEIGFRHWLHKLCRLAQQANADLFLYAPEKTLEAIGLELQASRNAQTISLRKFEDWDDLLSLAQDLDLDDLLVVISARKETVSYLGGMDPLPGKMSRYFRQHNFLLIYPEQSSVNILPKSTN
ncbi:MAG: sodium:proton antiporter [Candidatus Melainabacteria bacterium HGW-Melainabacteria-1]|nr:MAG: sodium:proton antiporter [Candidatus Melainabacteria bacterium HGW-Melainabacteria-1]